MSVYSGKFSVLDPSIKQKSIESQEGFNAYLEKDIQTIQKKIDDILDARKRRAMEIRQLNAQIERQRITISVMRKFAFKDSVNVNEHVVRASEAETMELHSELVALKKKLNLSDRFKKTLEENRMLKQRLLNKTTFCTQSPLSEPSEENTLFESLMYTKVAVAETMKTCFEEMDVLFPRGAPSMEDLTEDAPTDVPEDVKPNSEEIDYSQEYIQEIVVW